MMIYTKQDSIFSVKSPKYILCDIARMIDHRYHSESFFVSIYLTFNSNLTFLLE